MNAEYEVITTDNSMHGWSHTSVVCRAGCILATVRTVNAAEAYERKQDASSSFLHQDLAYQFKSSLSSSRKSSPEVRIEVPFDKKVLRAKVQEVDRAAKGNKQYNISSHDDLDDLSGKNWHVCGLNHSGDCCYPILITIRFYLHPRSIVEYTLTKILAGPCW